MALEISWQWSSQTPGNFLATFVHSAIYVLPYHVSCLCQGDETGLWLHPFLLLIRRWAGAGIKMDFIPTPPSLCCSSNKPSAPTIHTFQTWSSFFMYIQPYHCTLPFCILWGREQEVVYHGLIFSFQTEEEWENLSLCLHYRAKLIQVMLTIINCL